MTIFHRFNEGLLRRSKQFAYPYRLFGIFGLISYPFYYALWVYVAPQGYENILIRTIASLLCIPLILKNHWPRNLQKFLPLYWYTIMLYCLPFFFTFMLLKNNLSYDWVLNTLTGIVLSILLLDLLALFIIYCIGISLGWWLYIATTPRPELQLTAISYQTLIITYGAVIIFGALFAHRKERIHQEIVNIVQSIASTIAHELRTPLRAISSGLGGIKKNLKALIDTYQIAKSLKLEIPYIHTKDYQQLPEVLTSIQSETRSAFAVIDMLLVRANLSEIDKSEFKSCSIAHCVEQGLKRYAFDKEEAKLVTWNSSDFRFSGDETLMIHVLFNLFNNALYYIKAAGKGEIIIWIEQDEKFNTLHFKDTGKGISPKVLPHIFDRFYTKTTHGTGLGLAFCKMVMHSFEGDIICQSKEGEYAEFILKFPK